MSPVVGRLSVRRKPPPFLLTYRHQNRVNASTQGACCAACGMDPGCVAAVLTCPLNGGAPCDCNLKPWAADARLMHTPSNRHTTLTCLTGRQNITGD